MTLGNSMDSQENKWIKEQSSLSRDKWPDSIYILNTLYAKISLLSYVYIGGSDGRKEKKRMISSKMYGLD